MTRKLSNKSIVKIWLTNIHLMVKPKLIFGSIWYSDLTIQKLGLDFNYIAKICYTIQLFDQGLYLF